MKNLDDLGKFVESLRSPDKVIISEMIAETKKAIKAKPKDERALIIQLGNNVNILCVNEPNVEVFRVIKSHLDHLIKSKG